MLPHPLLRKLYHSLCLHSFGVFPCDQLVQLLVILIDKHLTLIIHNWIAHLKSKFIALMQHFSHTTSKSLLFSLVRKIKKEVELEIH